MAAGFVGKKLTNMQWLLVGVLALSSSSVGGAIGLVVGADLGGNFFPTLKLGNNMGWEATGQLGLAIGLVAGALSGGTLTYLRIRRRNSIHAREIGD